jgi:hypothetical protein
MNDEHYIVRWVEQPHTMTHQLLILRRAGPGQVDYLADTPDGRQWVRTEPAATLPAGAGVVVDLPSDALPAVRDALDRALGIWPQSADAAEARVEELGARVDELREALAREYRRVDRLLDWALVSGVSSGVARDTPPE